VIKALGMYDRKLTEAACAVPAAERTPELARTIGLKLDEEAFLVQSILKADNAIILLIEGEKTRLQREAAATQKSKELAGKFKSGWVPESGEGLDQKA
jgi:hypothetical protein